MRRFLAASLSAMIAVSTIPFPSFAESHNRQQDEPETTTPIKHVVVIFGENISFDHYFGTYPKAQNNSGETRFHYIPSTHPGHDVANNLITPLDPTKDFAPIKNLNLLTDNPNGPTGSGATFNGTSAANPFRLAPSQAGTADQSHAPKPEQVAYDNGKVDQFPGSTGAAGPPPSATADSQAALSKGLVMGYFDGNTVTAMWNYANHFALNDNTYTSQFGPSTPGAINLISGQTNGFAQYTNVVSGTTLLHNSHEVFDGQGGFTLIGDAEPLGDTCSATASDNVAFAGKNIGDLLNSKNITWGWFQGGFNLELTNANGTTGCQRSTPNAIPGYGGVPQADYVEHHEPFQYYASTANLTHARPSSIKAIGSSYEWGSKKKDPANHQYDTDDFFTALDNGILPSVTFLKAPSFEDAHPGNSDPVDEQAFVVNVINALQESTFWDSTAVVITYDDSDGWYDHQMPSIVNPSTSLTVDALNAPGVCQTGAQQKEDGKTPDRKKPLNGVGGLPVLGRCGYGTRLPLLVISPWAKDNYIDHTLLDQTSIIRFIEDNFLGGKRIQPGGSFDSVANSIAPMFDFNRPEHEVKKRKLFLDPNTGAIVE
ncbi:phospholipase C [Acidicapsa dinghuensis]|uniref:Phospholipase C n=1 Tax=Acidicapsa dinghuensis TaxID=2218256 RepID=A0ABW1EH57_9BACT|nr:alkaline phosphatase family protein [Acidicapsa dinghuensis]